MAIIKSKGVTPTERWLADLCERSFLKLWSYPNPFKNDGKELCDLLAVFENNVFIFFDRENRQLHNPVKDPIVNWKRWKKKVVDAQICTAHGAERYVKRGQDIFLDNQLNVPFPIDIDVDKMIIHKIIIAHGAKEVCEQFSNDNVYGSLAISYGNTVDEGFSAPFLIHLDKENPVHVFDSHNLPIIFSELDTVFDFTSYLEAKINAINSFDRLAYCGEEDLLANYYLNFDESKKCHFIGTQEKGFNWIGIGEGEWKDFIDHEIYKNKKIADQVSFFWDELLQRTCQNALDGTLLGNSDLLKGKSAIHEMAKEPRFWRRALSEQMIQAIKNFPENSSQTMMTNISFMPSFFEKTGYVFLQLKMDGPTDCESANHQLRKNMLEIACGSAKNKFSNLNKIVGIAMDAPKFVDTRSEDFLLMDCEEWSDDLRAQYEQANEVTGFFNSSSLMSHKKIVKNFPNKK